MGTNGTVVGNTGHFTAHLSESKEHAKHHLREGARNSYSHTQLCGLYGTCNRCKD